VSGTIPIDELYTKRPPRVTKNRIQIIQDIVEEVLNLEKEVNALPPTPNTANNYIYLDGILSRNLMKLGTIETMGKDHIRLARRDCINLIQKVISTLKGKSSGTVLVPFTGSNAGNRSTCFTKSSSNPF